ncbi:endonuclease/Exonuclease/phosphatase family protein [Hirsutella rhossiliensis]|uniref:Endonuclease/Exonuclease/phosphatase family domain-containing protein n=1 Tax=Hirsutella rhossiliensis TaxID=111463 RepID=A0A9P8SME3_9HYPO|nr:endonuclease/Exonuclease/phosphatase family domain-containing protein [Hirsutella rhossiliensis]KAH0968493.1 endonuclease/Exonuclease/phosphatase family domain-containing protein [Hirsutella rhossiliensis]
MGCPAVMSLTNHALFFRDQTTSAQLEPISKTILALPMFSLRSSLAAATLGLMASLLAAPAAAEDSTLSVASGKPPLTFNYSTPSRDSTNWVGIYNPYFGAPDNGKWVARSLAWEYAPDSKGSVQVSASNLEPGTYNAYLLAKNEWGKLAGPIDVVVPGQGAMSFIVQNFTTQNARAGDKFEAKVKGLIDNQPDANTKFAKVASEGDVASNWVQVSTDGMLSGTPNADGETRVTVEATGSNGSKAQLKVKIPVRKTGSPMVDELGVLSFNIWMGGSNVNDSHRKHVRYLSGTGVDIVGFQESNGGQATRLGQALGWNAWQGPDVGIISRYPIAEVFPATAVAGAVRVALDGEESQVIVWNAHLGFNPYGPYDFCFDKKSVDQVLQREKDSGRTGQIVEIVDRMKGQIANADKVPVVLTGDFNSPSHLDWTEATRNIHCNVGNVPWPSSEEPTKAGMIDSFREMHPDPLAEAGNTWSPIFLQNENRPEPMDRIDFVYHKGLKTLDSKTEVVGQPKAEPNHKDNEWTSDHAAVKTIFRVDSRRARRAFRG